MSTHRTPDDRRIDAALLLALWARCSPRPREDAGDKLRHMKLAFLAARALHESRFHALSLTFFRWTWGPMSNEVYDAWSVLKRAGLIESEEHIVLTRAGESLARAFYDDIVRDEPNAPLKSAFDAVEAKWRDQPATAPLLDAVYSLCVKAIGAAEAQSIREIRKGVELIVPLRREDSIATVRIDGGWLETLALELNPKFAAGVESGIRDFVEGRVAVG